MPIAHLIQNSEGLRNRFDPLAVAVEMKSCGSLAKSSAGFESSRVNFPFSIS